MSRTIRAAVMAAVFATLLAVPRLAAAHPSPFSYLDIVFRNGGIEGTLGNGDASIMTERPKKRV